MFLTPNKKLNSKAEANVLQKVHERRWEFPADVSFLEKKGKRKNSLPFSLVNSGRMCYDYGMSFRLNLIMNRSRKYVLHFL